MEVKLLAFVLVSVLRNIYIVSTENSGKNSFSCFLIFGHTLSALLFHQYSVFRFTKKTWKIPLNLVFVKIKNPEFPNMDDHKP